MVNLERVLWIGGSSSAGKSTAARLLARRHGLRCYSTDTATWAHRDRAIAAGDPLAIKWEALTSDQRTALSPAEQLRLKFDRSPWVLADVHALPDEPAAIVEGTLVSPEWLPAQSVVVWLTAEPKVRASRTAGRGWGAAGGAVDLLKAVLLNERLAASGATPLNTTEASIADMLTVVEESAAQWIGAQSGVTDPEDRQALRRDINIALVNQHRSGWNRRGQRLDNSGVVRDLECECSDPFCVEFVPVKIATLAEPFEADSPPIIATLHR
jgi:broad-specificity NMP kinase